MIKNIEGTLVKSKVFSKFAHFHLNSKNAKEAFSLSNPNLSDVPIVVLQVMICSEGYFLIEYMEEDGIESK